MKRTLFDDIISDMFVPLSTSRFVQSSIITPEEQIIEKIKSEGFIIIARVFCFEDSTAPQRINAYVYEDVEKTKIWLYY